MGFHFRIRFSVGALGISDTASRVFRLHVASLARTRGTCAPFRRPGVPLWTEYVLYCHGGTTPKLARRAGETGRCTYSVTVHACARCERTRLSCRPWCSVGRARHHHHRPWCARPRPAGDETEQRAARARGLAFVVSHEPLRAALSAPRPTARARAPAATGTGTARHTQAFPFVPRPRDLSGRRPRQCVLHARFPACSLDGPTHKLLEGSDAGERWFY